MDYETFYQRLREPDLIPGYEILQKIGGGVFGEVFKCRKLSISRIYVVKFLKLDSDAQRAIIEKELAQLRTFAQIDHPNLVGIEDQGTVHEIPYIIMTFGGDKTLQDRTGESAMESEELANVFDQILAGVAALHERSIVHFDLKPANIFIRDDAVKVGDYGLSKMLTESRQSLSFGRGTPYYMAPEVMRRKGDLRADVYSLGAILFELATGRVPFDGESDWEVLRKHEVEPLKFPPELDGRLRPLIERAMKKEPDERFQNAVEFRAKFRAAFGRETTEMSIPLVPPPDPEVARAPTSSRGHQTAERVNRLARDRSARIRDRLASTPPVATATRRPAAAPIASSAPPVAPTPETPSAVDAPEPRRRGRWLQGVLVALVVLGCIVAFMIPRRSGIVPAPFENDSSRATPARLAPTPVEPQPATVKSSMPDLREIAKHLEQGGTLSEERAAEMKQVLEGLHMWFNDQAKMLEKIEGLVQQQIDDEPQPEEPTGG